MNDAITIHHGGDTLQLGAFTLGRTGLIVALGKCEDENYPPPAQGREKLVGFLRDCVREADYDKIAAKYKIPQRDGVRVVNTNGADIDLATAEMPLWRMK